MLRSLRKNASGIIKSFVHFLIISSDHNEILYVIYRGLFTKLKSNFYKKPAKKIFTAVAGK